MGDNLFTAYNYLSSAIAQAFAALIGLTAVFFIYRRGVLKQQMKEVLNYLILFTMDQFVEKFPPENVEVRLLFFLEFNKLNRPEKIFDVIKGQLGKFRNPQDESLCKLSVSEYLGLQKIYSNMTKDIIAPLLFSTFAMFIGIAALLIGSKICSDGWRFGIMIGESVLAAVALGWTVAVVIRMLRTPEEPKAEESPSPSASLKRNPLPKGEDRT